MDLAQLQRQFGIAGVLAFDQDRGMTRLRVTKPALQAILYLQGAHLTHWKPACQDSVIFLSRTSSFQPGKPIRGGIPIVFPWFATDPDLNRVNGHRGPSHGFARLEDWTMTAAHEVPKGMHLALELGPTESSRSMGFDHFLLSLDVTLADDLTMSLTVRNTGPSPFTFGEAFHNYFSVVDVHEASIDGLETAAYIDKIDSMKEKSATGSPIRFTGPTDRVYLDTTTPCVLHDGAQRRDIRLVKTNSRNTVVWNPGKPLPDLGEWDWHEMLCMETVNTGANQHTLAPAETFTMAQHISIHRWPDTATPSARSPRDTA